MLLRTCTLLLTTNLAVLVRNGSETEHCGLTTQESKSPPNCSGKDYNSLLLMLLIIDREPRLSRQIENNIKRGGGGAAYSWRLSSAEILYKSKDVFLCEALIQQTHISQGYPGVCLHLSGF